MCGIVGSFPTSTSELKSMNDKIIHRGPDSEGVFIDDENSLGIGMRRLSIIDLEGGSQPIFNEDKSIIAVCNGEIYNYKDLRKDLTERGHTFRTDHSDVEVIVHLYEEYGFELLQYLNGMFAFALYDKKKQLLFGARDRLGIKPLYIAHKNKKFAFASEIKSLLSLDWISKETDPQAVSDYFSLQFIPAEQSIYKDIKKVKPAHYYILDLNSDQLSIVKYWELNLRKSNVNSQPRSIILKDLLAEMQAAFERWNESDVPVAVSLSGGLDSSTLLGILNSQVKDSRFQTYSVGFNEEEFSKYSELEIAKRTAERWNSEHHVQQLDASELITELRSMVKVLDEPYGGGLPSWFVYKQMAGKVKVAHTGTGGDEIFGNYGKAKTFRKDSKIRLARIIKSLFVDLNFRKAFYLMQYPVASSVRMFFRDYQKKDLFKKNTPFSSARPTEKYINSYFNVNGEYSLEDQIGRYDIENQLAEEFLMMTDRFSMAYSIEARVPFLDHNLVEFGYSISSDHRVGNDNPKQLLIDVAKDYLNEEVYKNKKRGFVLPLKEWTRNELKEDILRVSSPMYLEKQGIFNSNLYQKFLKEHIEGKTNQTELVWTFYMFQLWYEVAIGE